MDCVLCRKGCVYALSRGRMTSRRITRRRKINSADLVRCGHLSLPISRARHPPAMAMPCSTLPKRCRASCGAFVLLHKQAGPSDLLTGHGLAPPAPRQHHLSKIFINQPTTTLMCLLARVSFGLSVSKLFCRSRNEIIQ